MWCGSSPKRGASWWARARALGARRVPLASVNWLGAAKPPAEIRCAVKLRSAHAPAAASLTLDGDGGEALLDEPAFAVAPGQACVFYDGERMLGGGWIRRHP